MSVFGTRLFGKVDVVPGFFHVGTKCWHINYVPLVPMKSYIVLSQGGNQFRGIELPLSWKSWGMAWFRFFGWVAVIVGLTIAIVGLTSHSPARPDEYLPGFAFVGIGAVVLVIAYLFKPLTHASYDRAVALAQRASFNAEGLAQLRKLYGLPPSTAPISPNKASVTQ